MKVAITVWENRVAPVFDVCRRILILHLENNCIQSQQFAELDYPTASLRIARLKELGIHTLVCGAVSEPVEFELNARGLRVIAFITGDLPVVIDSFLHSKLQRDGLTMPGCHRGRMRGRGRRRSFPLMGPHELKTPENGNNTTTERNCITMPERNGTGPTGRGKGRTQQ